MKKIGKIVWVSAIGAICLVLYSLIDVAPKKTLGGFLRTSAMLLQAIDFVSEGDVAQMTRTNGLVFARKFASGEWIAARSEHSCTDGAGFDAAVFRDSNGKTFSQVGYHFCGYEGLVGELNRIQAGNLAEFYAALSSNMTLMAMSEDGQQTLAPVSGTRGTPAAYAPDAPGIPER